MSVTGVGLQWKELLVLPLSNDEIVKLEGAIHAALQESEGDSRGIENLLYIVRVLRCRDVDAPIRTLEGVRGTCIVCVPLSCPPVAVLPRCFHKCPVDCTETITGCA